jgi:hypothetical protein
MQCESIGYNGVGEIRTHEGLAPLAVFKTELGQSVQIRTELLMLI